MIESVLNILRLRNRPVKKTGGVIRGLYGIRTAIWEMWAEFRHEWKRITLASIISPFLYMIALGWGLGSMVSTRRQTLYRLFLCPE